MKNSARIQSLMQQLVEALVDEVTAEVRMRTGTSTTPVIADSPATNTADFVPSVTSPKPTAAPKFEPPDFDQLLRDLEELRKPIANDQATGHAPQTVTQDSPAPTQTPASTPDAVSTPVAPNAGAQPFSGLSGAANLLKRVTGK